MSLEFLTQINNMLEHYMKPVSDFVYSIAFYPITIKGVQVPVLILWLIFSGLFFLSATKFVPIWGFKKSIQTLLGKCDQNTKGEISPFQASATALSSTIGMGNIAGVAIAISLGGPGACFWIMVAGFISMATKFTEVTLSLIYRKENADGSFSGGPMYYISQGLKEKGLGVLGKILSVFFAVAIVGGAIGCGNMLQINIATNQVINITGGAENSIVAPYAWLFGTIVAIIVAITIIGGIKGIARVTKYLTPFMTLTYIIGGLIFVALNITHVPQAIYTIVTQAFVGKAVTGGMIGALIIGFKRALQSNEAGYGSAPIIYSAVKTNKPIQAGFLALLEPFYDTVVLCSLTAFVIILSGVYINSTGIQGVELTSAAFSTSLPHFSYVLTLVVILFVISSIFGAAYYGQKAWEYLFGHHIISQRIYQAIYCLCIIIGSATSLTSVINFTDSMMFLAVLPNTIAMIILLPAVLKQIKEHSQDKPDCESAQKIISDRDKEKIEA